MKDERSAIETSIKYTSATYLNSGITQDLSTAMQLELDELHATIENLQKSLCLQQKELDYSYLELRVYQERDDYEGRI